VDIIFNETKMTHKPRVSKCESKWSRDDEKINIELYGIECSPLGQRL